MSETRRASAHPPGPRPPPLQTQPPQPPLARPPRTSREAKADSADDEASPALPRKPQQIDFPPQLPVSERREEIMATIRAHPVVIVCGETGSGKTTQLAKMALVLGRGRANAAPGQRGRLIGHTQPRRLAATSVAKRIAQELNSPLGDVVGYKIRFADRLAPSASVKLMTDGILLAETQTDPLLNAYDTLIIDEAHERSLNIDFLLGYLKRLMPQRPDLKVIITSATIDADRFARYFGQGDKPAPVIQVSGRLYPVEQRWAPFEESREYGQAHAIADAIDDLWREDRQRGDVLVFFPGEREIREAAEHLRGHFSHHPTTRGVEVLPLFARLSADEQDRVFSPGGAPRVVLATNVAETSLTVPGIRYVVDAGLARVKRYSFKSKVEQLLIEPISQAAAQQRAGRCGRVANGICVRLYSPQDFDGRPRFTDPEILRSSLAGVILRMASLRLGPVEDFDFIEAPGSRAITDGYQLLHELGAIDDAQQLTPIGQQLARLPLDPRVGRMLVEAKARGALGDVLVIASALSVQDVRDRPPDQQAQADQAHAQWDDDKSEFAGLLRLWQWLHSARGGDGHAHKLSHRQFDGLLKKNYLSPRRVREWRDIHSQLLATVTEQGWKVEAPKDPAAANASAAGYENLHRSLLAGLLGHVGCKLDDEEVWLGARGIKFYKHPGHFLKKKPGRWLMAGELVQTSRLFGRTLAQIEPHWLEVAGAHLLKKQVLDPHWEKKAGDVMALERATLYGLVVYNNRKVPMARFDPAAARQMFIREALVTGDIDDPPAFLVHNLKLAKEIEALEHKTRRQDVLVDDELLVAYYDQLLPTPMSSQRELATWWRNVAKTAPRTGYLTRDELMRHEAAGVTSAAFPRTVRLGGVDCTATYLHEPGDARDGLSVTVPLFVLNQVPDERCEWLVPGMLKDKVHALLKSLPQKPRSRFVPLPESAEKLAAELTVPEAFGHGSLTDAMLKKVRDATSLNVLRTDFKLDQLSAHLFMHIRVVDEHGRQLGAGRNLAVLKAELGAQARGAFAALAHLQAATVVADATEPQTKPAVPPENRAQAATKSIANPAKTAPAAAPAIDASQRHTNWAFGTWPELLEIRQGSQTAIGFAALQDAGDAVTVTVLDDPALAAQRHRGGLTRLFALQLRDTLKSLDKQLPGLQQMAVAFMALGGTQDELRRQIIDVAIDRAFLADPLPADELAFNARLAQGRGRLVLIAQEVARQAGAVLIDAQAASRKLKDASKGSSEAMAAAVADAQSQLQRLVPKRFVADTPWVQLQHLPRYLKAIVLRIDKCRADPARDAARLTELRPQEQRLQRALAARKGVADDRLTELRWLIEELRVSFFAQELRTPQPVSIKRLDKVWGQIEG